MKPSPARQTAACTTSTGTPTTGAPSKSASQIDPLVARLTGTLSESDLLWIEQMLPAIKEPFARLLILMLLLQVRKFRRIAELRGRTYRGHAIR